MIIHRKFNYSILICVTSKIIQNLAKLGYGLNESPTVMVGETIKKTENSVKIGPYSNPVGFYQDQKAKR